MSSFAVFTAPKAFREEHIALIQRNAIRSWQAMGEAVEIYLLGDEEGIAENARDLSVHHIPKVERNQQGTPLVSSLFQKVKQASEAEVLAYVNADILLFPETLSLVEGIGSQSNTFVLMGQRIDLDVTKALDFDGSWLESLRKDVKQRGQLHPPGGSDYFVFPRQLYSQLPDFAIGRVGWDNWMIFEAIRRKWRPVDMSPSVKVIHQNHDYAHLPKGQAHYRVDETDQNTALAGGMRQIYTLLDIKLEYRDGRIKAKAPSMLSLVRWIERGLQPNERAGRGLRWVFLRRLRQWRRQLVSSRSGR